MPPKRKRSTSSSQATQATEIPSPQSAPKYRKRVALASDATQVLQKCRSLREKLKKEVTTPDDAQSSIPQNILEVADLSVNHVVEGMEAIAIKVAKQVLSNRGFTLEVPSRAASNQIYIKEWDRIVLGEKRSTRHFLNVKVRRLVNVLTLEPLS